MSQTLNKHLQSLLENSAELLSFYRIELEKEWEELRLLLMASNKKQIEIFDFFSQFFLKFFQTVQNERADTTGMFSMLQDKWLEEFHEKPEPEGFMFHINLIENAAHKVLKEQIAYSSQLHPAVHYFFSKISEIMLYQPEREMLEIDDICQRILELPETHVKWIARIEERNGGFLLKKMNGDHPFFQMGREETPSFATWYELMYSLFGNTLHEQRLPILWKKELLLFGTGSANTYSQCIPLVFSILQTSQSKKNKMHAIHKGDQWKDAVILFNEWIIRSQNFNESIENISFGFGYFLPFQRCALFKLSTEAYTSIGLYGHHYNNEKIQAIAEKITNFPTLNESLVKLASQGMEMKNFQPIFIPNAQDEFPEKYVQQFQLGSLLIVPIYVPVEGKVIGGMVLDQGAAQFFSVDRSLFPALIKFGQSSGELLSKFIEAEIPLQNVTSLPISLTPREIEILKLLADGASTSEAAVKLYLSEYTVRDYISTLMKRLKAQNRTEMVVKALRMKLIH